MQTMYREHISEHTFSLNYFTVEQQQQHFSSAGLRLQLVAVFLNNSNCFVVSRVAGEEEWASPAAPGLHEPAYLRRTRLMFNEPERIRELAQNWS